MSGSEDDFRERRVRDRLEEMPEETQEEATQEQEDTDANAGGTGSFGDRETSPTPEGTPPDPENGPVPSDGETTDPNAGGTGSFGDRQRDSSSDSGTESATPDIDPSTLGSQSAVGEALNAGEIEPLEAHRAIQRLQDEADTQDPTDLPARGRGDEGSEPDSTAPDSEPSEPETPDSGQPGTSPVGRGPDPEPVLGPGDVPDAEPEPTPDPNQPARGRRRDRPDDRNESTGAVKGTPSQGAGDSDSSGTAGQVGTSPVGRGPDPEPVLGPGEIPGDTSPTPEGTPPDPENGPVPSDGETTDPNAGGTGSFGDRQRDRPAETDPVPDPGLDLPARGRGDEGSGPKSTAPEQEKPESNQPQAVDPSTLNSPEAVGNALQNNRISPLEATRRVNELESQQESEPTPEPDQPARGRGDRGSEPEATVPEPTEPEVGPEPEIPEPTPESEPTDPNAGGTGSFGDRGRDRPDDRNESTDDVKGSPSQGAGDTDSSSTAGQVGTSPVGRGPDPEPVLGPGDVPDPEPEPTPEPDLPARGRDTQTGGQPEGPTDTSPTPEGTPPDPDNGPTPSDDQPTDPTTDDRDRVDEPDLTEPEPEPTTEPETTPEPTTQPQDRRPDDIDTTLDVSAPDAIQNEGILDSDFDIEAQSEQKLRSQLKSETAERFTQATAGALTFTTEDITVTETEEGFTPTLTQEAQSDIEAFRERGLRENLRAEAAQLFSQQSPESATFDPSDVRIEETQEGLRPTLQRGPAQELEQAQQEVRREQARESFTEREGIESSDIESISFEDGQAIPEFTTEFRQEQAVEQLASEREDITQEDIAGVSLTEEGAEFDLTQEFRREQSAEQLREEGDTPGFGVGYYESQRLQNMSEEERQDFLEEEKLTSEDITLTEDGATLTEEAKQRVAATQLDEQVSLVDIDPENITEQTQTRGGQTTRTFPGVGSESDLTLDTETQEDIAVAQLDEQTRTDITESDVDIVGGPSLSEEAQAEEAVRRFNQDPNFLPMHDEVTFTEEDVTVSDGQATLSESGQQKVREARITDALIELQTETGAPIKREDVEVSEADGQLSVSLADSGEKKVEVERSFGTDLPYVGGFFAEGAKTEYEVREFAEPARERVDEVIPGEQEFVQGAAVVAPVAAAEPTPVGEAGVGTILAAGGTVVAGSALANTALGTDPEAQTTVSTAVSQTEIQVPEGGEFVNTEEIQVPRDGSVTVDGSELTPQETPLTGMNEIDVTGDPTFDQSELGTPTPTGQVDPRVLQTQQLVQGQIGEELEDEPDTPTISREDILEGYPEPEQPAPSNRERQRREDLDPFERTFPTGGGAVVGEETERIEDAETPEVPEETTRTDITETGTGDTQPPLSGVIDRGEQAQQPDVAGEETTVQAPTQTPSTEPGIDTGTLIDELPGQQVGTGPLADVAQEQEGLQRTDPLQDILQAQLAGTESVQIEATQPATEGLGFGEPYEYAAPTEPGYPYEYGYGYRASLDREEPESDEDGDEEQLFGRAERTILTTFADPLSGEIDTSETQESPFRFLGNN